MAASNAVAAVGLVFKRNGTAVAEINSINGFDKSRVIADRTTLSSPSNTREKLGTVIDSGQITLNMSWTVAGFDALDADMASASNQSYTIVMTDSNAMEYAFSGWVSGLTLDSQLDDKINMVAVIDIDGVITKTS